MGNLNHRQRRFADEYLVDGNATQAAIRAGYSEKTAYSQGSRLLKNDEVLSRVREGQEKLAERTQIDAERVMREYARMGFADMTSLASWGGKMVEFVQSEELSPDDSAAVAEVSSERRQFYKDGDLVGETLTTRLKLHDKKGALDAMAKRLGLFDANAAGTGSDGDPLEDMVEGWKEGLASEADGREPRGLPGAAPDAGA